MNVWWWVCVHCQRVNWSVVDGVTGGGIVWASLSMFLIFETLCVTHFHVWKVLYKESWFEHWWDPSPQFRWHWSFTCYTSLAIFTLTFYPYLHTAFVRRLTTETNKRPSSFATGSTQSSHVLYVLLRSNLHLLIQKHSRRPLPPQCGLDKFHKQEVRRPGTSSLP